MRVWPRRFRRLALALVMASACAHRGTLKDGVFSKQATQYRVVTLPADWRRVEVEGNDLAWTHRHDHAALQMNARCGSEYDVPLLALSHHLIIGFTEVQEIERRLLPMDGREALRSHLRAKLDGVPRELALVVLKKDGCVYDFALVTAPGQSFDAALPALVALVDGFAVEHRQGMRKR